MGSAGPTPATASGAQAAPYHAYTIKNGRPIVLTLDFWTLAFDEFNPSYAREIVESLRLLD